MRQKIYWIGFVFLWCVLNLSFAQDELEDRQKFNKMIDEAVAKGTEYLISLQRPDGSFPQWSDPALLGSHAFDKEYPMGMTALCLLALLHSGVNPNEPVIEKGFEYVKELPYKKVYCVGTLLMALESRYLPPKSLKPKVIKRGESVVLTGFVRKLGKDQPWMQEMTDWLLKAEKADGGWEYSLKPFHADLSNTQYALLGLKAAARCQMKIPVEVWSRNLRYVLDSQAKTGPVVYLPEPSKEKKATGGSVIVSRPKKNSGAGLRARGWGYSTTKSKPDSADENEYGSMTTAGIACLILCKSELLIANKMDRKLLAETDAAIADGFAWLWNNWAIEANPKAKGFFDYYYLYGLERAALIDGREYIGDKNWYKEGAEFICQNSNRAINGSYSDDVAFALLFLKRATISVTSTPSDGH